MNYKASYPTANNYFDIVVFDEYGDGNWARAKYLVHGAEDVLWTNSYKDVIAFLKNELRRLNGSR